MKDKQIDPAKILGITDSYKQEAKEAKRTRMDLNKQNFDCYHLNQDFSHKKAGQSKEFLGKQRLSVEQLSSFIQQGIIDIQDWFSVEKKQGVKQNLFTENEISELVGDQLKKNDFVQYVGDSLKLGLLGSLMIAKVRGVFEQKPVYYTENKRSLFNTKTVLKREKKKTWKLALSLVRQENFYPDPTGNNLYVLEDIFMDYSDLLEMAQGEEPLYDLEVVKQLKGSFENADPEQRAKEAAEANQNVVSVFSRRIIKVTECWGTLIDSDGTVLAKDVTWSVANDQFLIQPPRVNPFWHGKRPYVISPIVRVPNSVWHTALMDAGTKHNLALNEIYNLQLDTAIMSTYGIKQLRTDYLVDETQISDGIAPGITLEVNKQCPPGVKVLERVDTAGMSAESSQMFNMTNSEFQQSTFTNDLRLGILPARQVKATEIVEASQSITSVLTGIAKNIEDAYLKDLLELCWLTQAQHLKEMDLMEIESLIGEDSAKKIMSMSNEEIFQEVAYKNSFNIFGVSRILNKQKDFRKLTALLQTISGSEVLVEEFVKKYDFGKLLEQIMQSLDINLDKLEHDEVTQATNMIAPQEGQPPMPMPGGQPNVQSQIPQAATGPLAETVESRIPRANFPPSRATPKAGF